MFTRMRIQDEYEHDEDEEEEEDIVPHSFRVGAGQRFGLHPSVPRAP